MELADLSSDASQAAYGFSLVLARSAAIAAMLPGLGEPAAPAMLRAGIALGLTATMLPMLWPNLPPVPDAGVAAAFGIAVPSSGLSER